MSLTVDALVVAMPAAYALVAYLYGMDFYQTRQLLSRLKQPVLAVVLVLHLIYVVVRTIAFDHPPITTSFEMMTLLAGCIAVAYWYIEWRTKVASTGFFLLLLAFIFQLISSLFIRDLSFIPEILRSRLLGFHVSSALLGYTGISLSAVYGFLYLMLYHDIKSSRFGVIYKRLPSLEMLEKMSQRSEVFGFVMLTVAIGIGLIWLPMAFEQFSFLDPKLIGTLAVWMLYAIGIGAKWFLGWQGRRTMVISVVAFCVVVLSMTVINAYLSGFHSFR